MTDHVAGGPGEPAEDGGRRTTLMNDSGPLKMQRQQQARGRGLRVLNTLAGNCVLLENTIFILSLKCFWLLSHRVFVCFVSGVFTLLLVIKAGEWRCLFTAAKSFLGLLVACDTTGPMMQLRLDFNTADTFPFSRRSHCEPSFVSRCGISIKRQRSRNTLNY